MTTAACHICGGTGLDQLWAAKTAKRWRDAHDVGVREIARRLRLSPSYVCDLEQNFRTWNHELLGRWIEACSRGKP